MMVGGPQLEIAAFFVIEHARIISLVVGIWFGLVLFIVTFYYLAKRTYVGNLVSVWGDVMPETPDARDSEDDAEKPAAVSVPCPTCPAKRMEYCQTITGLPMRLCHQSRITRYTNFLGRHWTV